MGGMNPPEVRYAKTADGVHIAYQVVGDGLVDLVFVMGWTSNIEAMWEEPNLARFLSRLASSSRLILFDKRGVGLSDRVPEQNLPTLETRMDDLRAVMDAVGSDRAVVMGVSEGGPLAMLFAATYPGRTAALVLFGTAARGWTPHTPQEWRAFQEALDDIDGMWGTLEYARKQIREWGAPHRPDDRVLAEWLASYLRRAASPGAAMALARMNAEIDVYHVLPAIHVPTLVLGRVEDVDFPIQDVRETAQAITGVRLVELPGADHFFWVGDQVALLQEIERFLEEVGDEEVELDRVLATVLFTDMVGSTETAVRLGDRRWRELLDVHHRRLRAQIARFGGREVDTAGDGFFATFDGPIRAVRCALAATGAVRDLGVEIRAGLHTGEIELAGDQVRGVAVHVGARIAALAAPSEVLTSSTVKDLVAGSSLTFEDRGDHSLKGLRGRWHVYRVASRGKETHREEATAAQYRPEGQAEGSLAPGV